jgi:hypothetical protein
VPRTGDDSVVTLALWLHDGRPVARIRGTEPLRWGDPKIWPDEGVLAVGADAIVDAVLSWLDRVYGRPDDAQREP